MPPKSAGSGGRKGERMRTRIDCCKGCTDRVADPNCHGYCEKYKHQKAEYDEAMAEIQKKQRIKGGITGQLLTVAGKVSRNRNLYHKHKRWG